MKALFTDDICQNIIFNGLEHKGFFLENIQKCNYLDSCHIALIYCLGISNVTRQHAESIYSFDKNEMNTESVKAGWQTSLSAKITRMALNLYSSATPTADDYTDLEEQLNECSQYSVDEIFGCEYAKYFWQTIQLRYPEYC